MLTTLLLAFSLESIKIIILSFKEEENKLMKVENKRDRKGNQKGEKLESS